ncbi:mitotic spindle assembly checkpoint protein MAD1-like isoform X2 [Hemicordylus capensis]|uniref:mitotic spindle assembly checkpoint protein MAD1-like isoform X2 n=1 Tax=Hemicordylus capensis TaxID=884348 RepID=UPI002302B2A1|nr:mitotic spindle assembly checkpoint protein MAD1-like isoform X2 [Hemicordylus capensis]
MGKRERRRLCEVVTFCCSVILLLTFLGLFMWQALGLRTCRAQLQNQTAQDQDPEVASFRKDRAELEAAEARAKEEGARLRAELGATNRSLGQAQQGWDTCRKQLNTLQENITSQKEESTQCETENHKFQEEIQRLQQKVSTQSQQLEAAQQQRQQNEATIRDLQEQLNNAQRATSGSTFHNLSQGLFLLVLAGPLLLRL